MIRASLEELESIVDGRVIASSVADARATSVCGVGTDTRDDLTGRLFVAIRGARHDGHDHLEAAVAAGAVAAMVEAAEVDARELVASEIPLLVVADPIDALASLARHHRAAFGGTVIGITGSAGKTTTRAILEQLLVPLGRGTASIRSFNNHLGVPITILEASPDDAWVILEMGTSGPGEIAHLVDIARPEIAILTGTGRAHLEGFGSESGVAAEKAAILDGARLGVVNVDRPAIEAELPIRRGSGMELITYGEHDSADRRLRSRTPNAAGGQHMRMGDFEADFALDGRHNAINAVAAIETARHLGVPDADIAHGLASIRPPAMRFARRNFDDVLVLDDAYNANPESMRASLEAFSEVVDASVAAGSRRIAVLGAMLELGGGEAEMHHEIGTCAAGTNLTHLFIVRDRGGDEIATGARAAGFPGTIEVVEDAAEAATTVASMVEAGDAVLVKASRGVGLEKVVDAIKRRREATG